MRNTTSKSTRAQRYFPGRCIPALVAVSVGLVALPASALELGELTVQSRLGQPLRASIAYALAPSEQLADYCVTMRPGPSLSGLPGFGPVTVRISNGVIMLTGRTPVREPMVSAHVVVNCPYSANLSREYLLFVDPQTSASEAVYQETAVTQQTSPQAEPIAVTPAGVAQPAAPTRSVPVSPEISTATPYQVQNGESLSEIAADYEPQPAAEVAPVEEVQAILEPKSDSTDIAATEVILDDLPDTGVTAGNLQPGDIILDARLAGPTTSSSWIAWIAGGGIAIILGLLMFGRRLRDHSGTSPAAPLADEQPQRRFSDVNSKNTESIESLEVDYNISDDSPTEENLILDVDLVTGTGLSKSSESDISQDFGFAATTQLDIELPIEPLAQPTNDTAMLPPLRSNYHSILDSEVLPEVDDDDYDMSVIVDATKMPRPEEATERDLKAVEVITNDDTKIVQNYTIDKEVDYQVLEKDYEDEMTATQALNQEIAHVAAELTERQGSADAENIDDETCILPLAMMTELDVTAQMPAQNDDISDIDGTSINESATVNLTSDNETVDRPVGTGKAR